MRKLALFTMVIATCLCSGPAEASDQVGRVTYVAQISNRFLFGLSGARGTRPGCDCCNRWEILVNSIDAQSRVAVIMTAFASGKTMNISGTGACAAGSNDTEEVSYLQANG